MTTEHTPTPWTFIQYNKELRGNYKPLYLVDANDNEFLYLGHGSPSQLELAEKIVRACNAHEDLVAALREAQAALNGAPNTVGLHTQIDAALAKAGAA